MSEKSNKVAEESSLHIEFSSSFSLEEIKASPTDLANPLIIAQDCTSLDDTQKQQWHSYIYKRIGEIYHKPIKVFDNISPEDILQHSLGDCYFLSALASLAEFPNRIEKLFDTLEQQASGRYILRLFDMGIFTDYSVDDAFPTNKTEEKKDEIAFTQPKIEGNTVEIWVLLLEKVWAKRFGGYSTIGSGGFAADSFRDLCGSPCEEIWDMQQSNLWNKILSANASNFIITAGTASDSGAGDEVLDTGIVTLHCYSILNAQEVNTARGLERLLRIRNPWGKTEWQGDWSDASPLWTPELKQKLGWTDKDDGTFWMRFEEFKYNYSSVTICRVHDTYAYCAVAANQAPGEFAVFLVQVTGGDTYFIVSLEDGRKFGDAQYQYSPLRMIVARRSGEELMRVDGISASGLRDVWVQANAPDGEYLVFVEIGWITERTNTFGVSVYSAAAVTITEVTLQEKNFLDKLCSLKLAQELGTKKKISTDVDSYEVSLKSKNPDTGNFYEGICFTVTYNHATNTVVSTSLLPRSFDYLQSS